MQVRGGVAAIDWARAFHALFGGIVDASGHVSPEVELVDFAHKPVALSCVEFIASVKR
jgi:hypothetical protein